MFVPNIEAEDKRWKYYATDGLHGKHYYDSKSLTYASDNLVRVWEKEFPSSDSPVKELTILNEIDCNKRMYRGLETHVEDRDGKVGFKFEPSGWSNIVPEGWMETLYDIVCKKKGK